MPLKKIKKSLEASLTKVKGKNPSTIVGGWFRTLKIKSIEKRIKNIETELINRKTKR